VVRVAIITKNPDAWCTSQLREALKRRKVEVCCTFFKRFLARVGYGVEATIEGFRAPQDLDGVVVRPIGRGSLEEVVFRMDFLRRLERAGVFVVNPPEAIEICVDKYRALYLLEEAGLPVPRTAVAEGVQQAMEAFHELGGDVVVKPLFGSRGVGSTRINDPEVARRVFSTLAFHHHVLYLQEFVPHGRSDVRAFVLGGEVIAAMRRVSRGWKTNISQGARPEHAELSPELEELAVKASSIVGCRMAGVDILEGPRGPLLIELNSQPGWKGLQTVTPFSIADRIADYVVSELKR